MSRSLVTLGSPLLPPRQLLSTFHARMSSYTCPRTLIMNNSHTPSFNQEHHEGSGHLNDLPLSPVVLHFVTASPHGASERYHLSCIRCAGHDVQSIDSVGVGFPRRCALRNHITSRKQPLYMGWAVDRFLHVSTSATRFGYAR